MEKIDHLTEQMDSLPKQIRRSQRQLKTKNLELERLKGLLQLDNVDLFDATLNVKLIDALAVGDPEANRYRTKRFSTVVPPLLWSDEKRVKEKRKELYASIGQLQGEHGSTEGQIAALEAEFAGIETRIRIYSDQLRDVRNMKDRMYRLTKGAQSTSATPASTRALPSSARAGTGGQPVMTAEDLRNTSFETFELPTELGRFLGKLDRNKLAFALTGDSGAGKSHFAFELTRLFSDEGYLTKYYCLEEGFGALTQQKIQKYDISPEVEFVDQATLADVRRDAGKYDLLVLDSFNKLNVGAEEFERLRTDFPRTIFIFIFQKTTTGSIRGGSSILFNSAATIDVVRDGEERIAHMIKGRYGTQGWMYDLRSKTTTEG